MRKAYNNDNKISRKKNNQQQQQPALRCRFVCRCIRILWPLYVLQTRGSPQRISSRGNTQPEAHQKTTRLKVAPVRENFHACLEDDVDDDNLVEEEKS